jgi:outer membrane protein OmpA-like peptidoglycan-associated protein
MKKTTLAIVLGMAGLLGGCATTPHDTTALDAKLNQAYAGGFGDFMHHEMLAIENLRHARLIRQYWKADHYWNIDLDADAMATGDRAIKHRQDAEAALIGWHDNCNRHADTCKRLDQLEAIHMEKVIPVAYFDTAKSVPQNVNQAGVDEIVNLSKKFPYISFDVLGYTDTVGSTTKNKALAHRRSHAVSDLLSKQGISKSSMVRRISVGEAGGPDNTANQQNRRVDVRIYDGDDHHHSRKK